MSSAVATSPAHSGARRSCRSAFRRIGRPKKTSSRYTCPQGHVSAISERIVAPQSGQVRTTVPWQSGQTAGIPDESPP